MKPKLNFFVKLFLSLLINFISFIATINLVMLFKFTFGGDFTGFYILFFSVISLTLLILFLTYRYKPLNCKKLKIIYWLFSFLGFSPHFWLHIMGI